jgi:hypothetical protein
VTVASKLVAAGAVVTVIFDPSMNDAPATWKISIPVVA